MSAERIVAAQLILCSINHSVRGAPSKERYLVPSADSEEKKSRGRAPDVRISKTLSWLLRHVADSEGLGMRTDGYVNVSKMVSATATTLVLSRVTFSLHIAWPPETEEFWAEPGKTTRPRTK